MEANYMYDEIVGLQTFPLSNLRRNQVQTETFIYNEVSIVYAKYWFNPEPLSNLRRNQVQTETFIYNDVSIVYAKYWFNPEI